MVKSASEELLELLRKGEITLSREQESGLLDLFKSSVPAMKSMEHPTDDIELKSSVEWVRQIDERLARIEEKLDRLSH